MMDVPPVTCVLFAAGFDWIEALLPFLFVAFWILSQVFAVFRRLQGGGQKPPPLPRFDPARDQRRPPPPRQPAGDADATRTELERQIADFLRETTGETRRRPDVVEPGRPAPPRTPRPQPVRTTATRSGPARPVAPPAARDKPRAPLTQRPAPGGPAAAEETSVSQHVHDAFARELTHLRGGLADGTPQANVSPAGAAAPQAAPSQAAELVHLLRSPATIRQVILLREVLDRPVDRW